MNSKSTGKSTPVADLDNLRDRVGHFLDSRKYGRSEVSDVLRHVGEVGRVFLFGGFLRDLALSGSRNFASDIDAVVAGCDAERLAGSIGGLNLPVRRNKFGGYRLYLARWKVDIWPVESTWAFKEGHVPDPSPLNLIKTTFFDWDAILFEHQAKTFQCQADYLSRLHARVLDINLTPSPNPVGNVVKAFRYCEKYDAALSSRLARYVYDQVRSCGAEELSEYEAKAHEHRVLTAELIGQFMKDLERHDTEAPIFPFKQTSRQKALWEPSGEASRATSR